ISDVLRIVFARPKQNFYDDVILIDERGQFLGFITTETLFKVQNALLLTNIRDLEERDREILAKNEKMETDLLMARKLQQALMPSTYPSFPTGADEKHSALHFYHRYLPASLTRAPISPTRRAHKSARLRLLADSCPRTIQRRKRSAKAFLVSPRTRS